jgi:zinc protease
MFRRLFLLSLSIFFSCGLMAQGIPYEPDKTLTFDPAVEKGKLDNGLTYYLRHNTTPADKVELRLMLNVGSILETDDQQGLAHFLEHLSFKKSRSFPEGDMIQRLEDVGVRFGYELNAYTSFEETIYYLPIASEHIDLGLSVIRDWALGLSLTDEEIDRERGVIIEEMRLGQSAGKRVREQYLPVLMAGSQYPCRLTIGKEEVLRDFPYSELRDFYNSWHRPDLMAVVAIGDIDPAEVKSKIEAIFGDIPSSAPEAPVRPVTVVPINEKIEAVVATDPETRSSSVEISYKHTPAKYTTQRDYVEGQIYNALYTSMANSRLSELIARMENPPFSSAESGYSAYFRGVDTYSSFASCRPEQVAEALKMLAVADERILRYGFTETELDRAKEKLMARYRRYYDERNRTASDLLADECQVDFLIGDPAPGVEFEYGLLTTVLPTITASQVSTLAARYMTSKGRTIVVTGPEKEGLIYPSREELIGIVEGVKGEKIERYDDGKVVRELMAKSPKPGQIISERYLPETGIYEWTLSNGAKVVIKPTDFKNNEILFRSTSDGGFSMYDAGYDMSALYATQIEDRSGVGGIDNIGLGRLMAGKTISLTQSLVMYNESMSGRFTPAESEDFFQLLYLYHTDPMFNREEFDKLMRSERSEYKDLLASPENLFGYRINQILNNGNPRRNRWPVASNLDQADFRRARKIYRDRFGNAAGFTFVLVGNVDPDEIRPFVQTYLAGIPGNPKSKKGIVEQNFSSPKQASLYTLLNGTDEEKARVSLRFFREAPWNKDKAFRYAQAVEILNTRIFEALRVEMGGIYGASVSGNVSRAHEQESSLSITFGTNTDSYRALAERAKEEVSRLLTEGPTQEETDRVKEKLRVAHNASSRQNAKWLVDIMTAYRYGAPVESLEQQLEMIEALTPENIAEAARFYIDPSACLEFILLPEPAVER